MREKQTGVKRLAILCSGGDVSGMNAAIKRFTEYCLRSGIVPFAVRDGYEGLIEGRIRELGYADVSGIVMRGGTVIGSARSERFKEATYRAEAAENLRAQGIDGLVILGGDGSFRGMEKLTRETGIACFGIPATIDNDIAGTQYCLGVDTALGMIRDAIDAIRDTASSFGRAFVVETMGRECGYLALVSALTGGAEMCLIPEIAYDLDRYKQRFLEEKARGRRYFIAVVSEALGKTDEIAAWFEREIGIESRVTVLGHIQRGGTTSVYDRLTAYRYITYAIDALREGKKNGVVCYNDGGYGYKPIEAVVSERYRIDEALLALGREFVR